MYNLKNNYHRNSQVKKYNVAFPPTHAWLPDHRPRGNCPTNSCDGYVPALVWYMDLETKYNSACLTLNFYKWNYAQCNL